MLANLSTSNNNNNNLRNGGVLDKYSVYSNSSKMVSSDDIYKIFNDDDENRGDLNNNPRKFNSFVDSTPKKHLGQHLTRNFVSFFSQNKKNLNKRSSSCNEKYIFDCNRSDLNADRSRKSSIREEFEFLPTEGVTTPGSNSFYRVNVSNEQFASVLEEMNHGRSQFPTSFDEANTFVSDNYSKTSAHELVDGDKINTDYSDQCSPDACSSSISYQGSKLSIYPPNFDKDSKSINRNNDSLWKTRNNVENSDGGTKICASLTSKLLRMPFSLKDKERTKKEKLSKKFSLSNGFSSKDSKSLTDLPRFSTTTIQTFASTEKRNSLHYNSAVMIENHCTIDAHSENYSEQKMANCRRSILQRPKSEHLHADQTVNMRTRNRTGGTGGSLGTVGLFGRKDNYETLEKLGEGSYATVYKGKYKIDGSIVALKEIKINIEEGCPFTAIREASLLKGLQHANIVLLHDIIYNKECLTFVFEYVQKDLGRYLEKYPYGIHPYNVKLYLYQLLRGLAYCHEKKILHRDMKPQNLLISDSGELKIADFGLARAKSVPSHTYSHEVVTLWYRPPDVLLGSTTYSTSLDMWGVGCIFAEMITGNALFPGAKDIFDQLDKIFRIMGTPNDSSFKGIEKLPNFLPRFFNQYPFRSTLKISPKIDAIQYCGSLLSSFLKMNPEERISARNAMNHAYFCDLPSQIHTLPHRLSIFAVPGIALAAESKPSTISNFRPIWNNNAR